MAVARLRFPDARCARAVADAFEKAHPEEPRGAREIRRAADRPGLAAELTGTETRLLAAEVSLLPPRARAAVEAAVEALNAAEAAEGTHRERAQGAIERFRTAVSG